MTYTKKMTYTKNRLKKVLEPYTSALVCVSGGLDSCLLLQEVQAIMGERVNAITFKSPLQTQRSIEDAKICADKQGVKHLIIEYKPLTEEGIFTNSERRCYLCKTLMFSIAYALTLKHGQGVILLDGTHLGDDPLLRPGMRANIEFGIRSPWKELGLGKAEIRHLARKRGLSNWDRPSDSCLATRFPLGYKLTVEELGKLEAAEDALRELGLKGFRFRPADSPPRLLLSEEDHSKALTMGFDKIRGIIREKTGWRCENCFVERRAGYP